MTRVSQSEQQEARERLLEWLKPGDTVYTILRHVSRSGMCRHISPVKLHVREDTGEVDVLHLDSSVAQVLGRPEARNRLGGDEGIVVGGCGQDMGFHLVYSLSRALWPEGYECIGPGCPANDHVNARHTHCPVCGVPLSTGGEPILRGHHLVCSVECASKPWVHQDGGYALRHRWI